MKTTYISYIGLLLLFVLLLPTGCSQDETEEGILTNKPGENGVICLSQDATILLEQEMVGELVYYDSAIFYLLPCKSSKVSDSGKPATSDSNRYLLIDGEKGDDGNFYLDFPAGTECMPYMIVMSTDKKGIERQDLGLKVILSDDGVLYTSDTYNEEYRLFGEGTAEAPFHVCQLMNLKDIGLASNEDGTPTNHAGKYFRLEVDIMCNDEVNQSINIEEGGISPIGMRAITTNMVIIPFCGNFDGNNHCIYDLSLRSVGVSSNLGLFSAIDDGAVIHNLNLHNMVISSSNENIGGLVGLMKGNASINNCHANVNLTGCRSVGALVGRMENGTITGCKSSGQVSVNKTSSSATYAFGGIVGNIQPAKGVSIKIDNVENGATIDATENVGGVVGFIGDTGGGVHTLSNVKSMANNITGLRSVGGLVGGCSGGLEIKNGYSSTRLSAPVDGLKKDCGGLVGAVSTRSSFTLTDCEVKSPVGNEVSIISGFQVGGLVGYAGALEGTLIDNCNSNFSVMTMSVADNSSDKFVGGLVGRANSAITLKDSECTAKIVMSNDTTKNGAYVGGLVGRCDDKVTITNCINSAVVKTAEYAGGLVGSTEDVTITNSENMADVTATRAHAGGLVGYARHCDISDITIKKEGEGEGSDAATISSGWRAGGVIGLTGDKGGKIYNCTIGGHINEPGNSQNSKCAGGIIGEIFSSPGMTIENVTYKGSASSGQYTGGIVGYSNGGTFIECTTDSKEKILATKSGYAGGIAGLAEYSSFSKCINGTIVDINKADNDNIGGIIGYNFNSTLIDCTNNAVVNAPERAKVGGICGYARYNANRTYTGCLNSGSVGGGNDVGGINGLLFSNGFRMETATNTGAVSGGDRIGGINGYHSGAIVSFSANRGTVNGNRSVGGINGKMNSTGGDNIDNGTTYRPAVSDCYNIGTINGNFYVGGISGDFEYYSYAMVTNCYNRGRVGHNGTSECAGIVGNVYNTAKATIESCYSGTTERTGYGVVGHCLSNAQSEVAVFNTYYLSNSATSKDDHGYSKTVSRLDNQGSFHFDFNRIWVMKNGYPQLQRNLEK